MKKKVNKLKGRIESLKEGSQSSGFVNLCTKYRLEDELEELDFNIKYNDPKYSWIFLPQNDLTSYFFEAIIKNKDKLPKYFIERFV